ncbi:MAG: uracil-DNA glycosylase [Proteobacteria bacterium]|nr:uracil-DNA glycosylase [Pseudomonadota bacterium]
MSPDWYRCLSPILHEPRMQSLTKYLQSRLNSHAPIFPSYAEWFYAFQVTPLNKVHTIILGQDPYHGVGQAHGLCFSVPDGVPLPPSLKNIFKELYTDLGIVRQSGNLSDWAQQGILLLNTCLTVEDGMPGIHQKKGWEFFTDQVISLLDRECSDINFVLWGSYALQKKALINASKHRIIESVHPSPLSAYRGFFGSRPFSTINKNLAKIGKKEVLF